MANLKPEKVEALFRDMNGIPTDLVEPLQSLVHAVGPVGGMSSEKILGLVIERTRRGLVRTHRELGQLYYFFLRRSVVGPALCRFLLDPSETAAALVDDADRLLFIYDLIPRLRVAVRDGMKRRSIVGVDLEYRKVLEALEARSDEPVSDEALAELRRISDRIHADAVASPVERARRGLTPLLWEELSRAPFDDPTQAAAQTMMVPDLLGLTYREEANALTSIAVRHGFLEALHIGRDATDPERRITGPEMKKLMIETSAKLAHLLYLRDAHHDAYLRRMLDRQETVRAWERKRTTFQIPGGPMVDAE